MTRFRTSLARWLSETQRAVKRGACRGCLPWLALLLVLILPTGCNSESGPAPISDEVPEAKGWTLEVLARNLENPWGIAWLPDGSALITERPGRLRWFRNGQLEPEPVAGLPPVRSYGQGGLLDIALHPDFATNRLVYFSLAQGTPEANRTALARGAWRAPACKGWRSSFRTRTSRKAPSILAPACSFCPTRAC